MLLNPYRFGFTPLDLPNIVGWWDFSDASTITLNGSDVSQIDDKSTVGHNLIQATSSLQPTLITSGQNGLDTADFTNDVLKTGGSEAWNVGTGDWYFACVIEPDTLTSFRTIMDWSNGAGDPLLSFVSGEIEFYFGGALRFVSLTPVINTPVVLELWRTGTSVRCRLNGISDTDSITSSANFGSNSVLWCGDDSFFEPFDGEIMEIIFCDGTEITADRDACKDYLKSKWGT